jgi:hypothetical protein
VDILTSQDRYKYFIHASADMISSVSVDLDALGHPDEGYEDWGSGKNYLHIVSPNIVLTMPEMIAREVVEKNKDERYKIEVEDFDQMKDLSKRVRGATLLDLYVRLIQTFDHFYDDEEEDFYVIA